MVEQVTQTEGLGHGASSGQMDVVVCGVRYGVLFSDEPIEVDGRRCWGAVDHEQRLIQVWRNGAETLEVLGRLAGKAVCRVAREDDRAFAPVGYELVTPGDGGNPYVLPRYEPVA